MRIKKQFGLATLIIAAYIGGYTLGNLGKYLVDHYFNCEFQTKIFDGQVLEFEGGKKFADINYSIYDYTFPSTNGLPQAKWRVFDSSYDIRYSTEALRALNDKKLVVRPLMIEDRFGKQFVWGDLYEIKESPINDPSKLEKGSRIPTKKELEERFYERK